MATNLLRCCICPKRPNFSDTSHLLTHVSSKGHLSHLHKLQVRSHQELSAGQQLVEYNQWFVDHDVAHLLSERMLQKEKKQAKRKADNKDRLAASKRDLKFEVDPNLSQDTKPVTAGSRGYTATEAIMYDELQRIVSGCVDTNTIMSQSTPTFENNKGSYPALHTRTNSLISCSGTSVGAEQGEAERLGIDSTPEMARLKGTIWPGMDIFDSADAETQRKRNQRKDVSVIERMQALSEKVVPIETVCSPGGTMKKKRHMDDLEDDSPVEGESPVIKQFSKRKRKALAPISKNTSRLALRSTKRPQRTMDSVSTPTKALSSIIEPQIPSRFYSPLSMDPFISGFSSRRAAPERRRRQHFAIFNDRSVVSSNIPAEKPVANPFFNADQASDKPGSSISPSKTWMQSLQHPDLYEESFKGLESIPLMTDIYSTVSADKDNANPLAWQYGFNAMVHSPDTTRFGLLDDFDDSLEALAEVYAFTRNPLTIETPTQGTPNRTPFRQLPQGRDHLCYGTPVYR